MSWVETRSRESVRLGYQVARHRQAIIDAKSRNRPHMSLAKPSRRLRARSRGRTYRPAHPSPLAMIRVSAPPPDLPRGPSRARHREMPRRSSLPDHPSSGSERSSVDRLALGSSRAGEALRRDAIGRFPRAFGHPGRSRDPRERRSRGADWAEASGGRSEVRR